MNKNRKNLAVFVTFFSNKRISASFYRLLGFEIYVREQMRNFYENKKFASFFVILDKKCFYKKTRQYIYKYGAALRGPRAYEVAQLQKKVFSEFSLQSYAGKFFFVQFFAVFFHNVFSTSVWCCTFLESQDMCLIHILRTCCMFLGPLVAF